MVPCVEPGLKLSIVIVCCVPERADLLVFMTTSDVVTVLSEFWVVCTIAKSLFWRMYFQPGMRSVTPDIFGEPGSLSDFCAQRVGQNAVTTKAATAISFASLRNWQRAL